MTKDEQKILAIHARQQKKVMDDKLYDTAIIDLHTGLVVGFVIKGVSRNRAENYRKNTIQTIFSPEEVIIAEAGLLKMSKLPFIEGGFKVEKLKA